MIKVDDRTPAQLKTHPILIAMTDSFMSGWGAAQGGTSYAAWACRPEHKSKVLAWVESRTDALRVRIVGNDWRPRGIGHAHIYVVEPGHAALGGS